MKNIIEAEFISPSISSKQFLVEMWHNKSKGKYLECADGEKANKSISTSVLCFWNYEKLYVLFKGSYTSLRLVKHNAIVEIERGKTLRLWELSDVFEFFITPENAVRGNYYELMVSPDGRYLDARIMNDGIKISADYSWQSETQYCSVIDSSTRTWYSLIEIPLQIITINPKAQMELMCNFFRASGKYHGDELLAWSKTGLGDNCFHQFEKFGKLILKK